MTTKELVKDPLNLIITGVGGQGNVMISLIIGNALVKEGYLVTIGETYGASQRNGPVMSHVRISKETQYSPFIPDGHADIILGMEPVETLRMLGQFGNTHVITIVNPRPIYSIDVTAGAAEYPDMDKLMETVKELSAETWTINATEEAQKMGSPIFANTILVGALIGSGVLPLDKKSVEPVLREAFPKEVEANMTAFEKGMKLISQ
ncbi:MAG: indolepyruvate oxidoreductase subunit beta [Dehalococcoidia bacterium]|nr:indolepyruvate oxidoreductase subunit beta [Dehalococcoidia bacterium]